MCNLSQGRVNLIRPFGSACHRADKHGRRNHFAQKHCVDINRRKIGFGQGAMIKMNPAKTRIDARLRRRIKCQRDMGVFTISGLGHVSTSFHGGGKRHQPTACVAR
jgi:hypothetical protein